MVLFVFIGHSPIKSDLAKEVAKRKKISYTTTFDYSVKTELVKGVLKKLNAKKDIILDAKSRTNEIFSNSFIKKLEAHFVIYFVLSAEDNKTLENVRNWPDYFVFNYEQQSVELIYHMIGEIMQLTSLFSKYKPFKDSANKSFANELFTLEPLDALNKMPIQGLYYLMLNAINGKSVGTANVSLKEVVSTLMHFNSIPTKTMKKGTPILRVRFNEMNSSGPILYKKIRHLWHPPKLKTGKGRFNREKQPVFYAADNLFTCFYETHNLKSHGEKGYVTALISLVTEDITEGYISSIDTHLTQGKNIFYDSFVRFYKGKISDKERLIKNFLGNYLNSHINYSPNFNYEITNLISDILYKNDELQAFMYPSTKINMQYNNIVLNEKNAKKYIIPHGVIVYSFSFPRPFEVALKPIYYGKIKTGRIKYKAVERPVIQSTFSVD